MLTGGRSAHSAWPLGRGLEPSTPASPPAYLAVSPCALARGGRIVTHLEISTHDRELTRGDSSPRTRRQSRLCGRGTPGTRYCTGWYAARRRHRQLRPVGAAAGRFLSLREWRLVDEDADPAGRGELGVVQRAARGEPCRAAFDRRLGADRQGAGRVGGAEGARPLCQLHGYGPRRSVRPDAAAAGAEVHRQGDVGEAAAGDVRALCEDRCSDADCG